MKANGIKADRIFFSPHIVDETVIASEKRKYNRDEVRKSLGIKRRDTVFLFNDMLEEESRPMVMAEAVAKLVEIENAKFIFAGDGSLLNKIQSLCNKNSIFLSKKKIDGAGYLLCATDVLVICSDTCQWSRTVNVPMNWELPVIVSDGCIAARDLVIDGYTGYSFYKGDSNSLAVIMKRFLSSPNKAHRMGFAASSETKNYSLKQSASAIIDAINYVTK
ncbi:MAG: glycosyltransferase family 4 protein [Lentisphaerae bacterium]|nr:glycosyltransferase family 4 protein [Lentisphaerota bacterium]MCP4101422.1 glycosyltransferase family 4 protein [Lentisphaerota bacterium]